MRVFLLIAIFCSGLVQAGCGSREDAPRSKRPTDPVLAAQFDRIAERWWTMVEVFPVVPGESGKSGPSLWNRTPTDVLHPGGEPSLNAWIFFSDGGMRVERLKAPGKPMEVDSSQFLYWSLKGEQIEVLREPGDAPLRIYTIIESTDNRLVLEELMSKLGDAGLLRLTFEPAVPAR